MRKLVFVPMIHSPKDFSETRKQIGIENIELPEEFNENSSRYWEIVKEAIANLNLKDARIFFEGYWWGETFAGEIDERWKDRPEAVSLSQLLANGSTLEQTENKRWFDLTVESFKEYGEILNYMQQELEHGDNLDGPMTEEDVEMAQRLVNLSGKLEYLNNRRDEFVARRITQTLQEGEIGILFMGGSHDIVSKLPADIEVTLLDERLNEFREFFQESRKLLTPEGVLAEFAKGPERKG